MNSKEQDNDYDLVKDFYTEYLICAENISSEYQIIKNNILDKYFTPILKEETFLATEANDYDVIIAGQDASCYLENMEVIQNNNENVKVVFSLYKTEGDFKNILEIETHVSEFNGQRKIDNLNWHKYDISGNLLNKYITRWANKKQLTAEEMSMMKKLKEYHVECFKKGHLPANLFSEDEITIDKIEKYMKEIQARNVD